ncbi:FtsX-like permease family protein [Streptomyces sp. NPDC059255]|uniref:FtsX-like permease family protein n=1 Tax=Streptomyces sp. NPDC059255 TaxID=3346793 RepID=UPI0036982D9F
MSAVWRASRGAVRRRRLQTFVIGLVVLCSTVTVLLALAVLDAASAPFDRAFAEQRGAHAVASFDAAKVSDAQLARTAGRPGVAAAAGPFGQAVLELPESWLFRPAGALTVVGRADPAGPVDRIRLLTGRWATAPGELVVEWPVQGTPDTEMLGTELRTPGAPPLTVVGFAASMSRSAGGWVTPGQVAALHPTSAQMLYRFQEPGTGTDARLGAGLDNATAGLPAGALTGAQSYLTLKRTFSAQADAYLPFMTLFGVLGLLVSVLIVGNVVSGAVVSGYRHIGVLKALGFTPNQVVAVYLTMVSVPAVAGSVLGTALGNVLAGPVLKLAFGGIETGTASIGVSPWLSVVCLPAMPALVVLAALVPALRAHSLPAARAISAGSAPRTGRGLRVQRWLGGTRLPRPVSLGLGQPFARPGRTLLTMAAIVLGVTTVTLTTGLTSTMVAYAGGARGNGADRVDVDMRDPEDTGDPEEGGAARKPDDRRIEARLRALPGTGRITVRALAKVRVAGVGTTPFLDFYWGDTRPLARRIVEGHWPDGPREIAAGPAFLKQNGLAVGDRTTLYLNGRQLPVTVAGRLIDGDARSMETGRRTMAELAPDVPVFGYTIQLADGTDTRSYLKAVEAVDPALRPSLSIASAGPVVAVVTFSTVFTVLLTVVAALGVFNTVLLNTQERRRDLGMLKSIGMTPRQTLLMTVTSVAGPGAAGGLLGVPLGIVAHRLVVDNVGIIEFPESMKNVWHVPQLTGLALAGVTIAVLGALVPARSAARLTIARVLHNE